jgi:hypothetical protein
LTILFFHVEAVAGNEESIFIIQIAGGLTLAANLKVTLTGLAKAENIYLVIC